MTTAIGAYATGAALKARLGIGDVVDDTQLGIVCDQVNAYIEGPEACGRVIAPIASATYLIDIEEQTDRFHFPLGVRAISSLKVGDYTGATRATLAVTDYFLRPSVHLRPPGVPATLVVLSDRGSRSVFPEGFEVVSMTATAGWAAIPDDITEVALTAATRAWHGIQAGQADIVGTDEMGRPLVSRFFSSRDLGTLRAYSVNIP
jgi:hypothetical protein